MALTLMFEGRVLGEVEFGPADPPGGLRQGRLTPAPAYLDARPALQVFGEDGAALYGLTPEEVQGAVAAALGELTRRGLALYDHGRPVPVRFLMVAEYFPRDLDLETLTALGILVAAELAPDT